MKLEKVLNELKNLIGEYEYIQIIYGNAWEVQFHTQAYVLTEVHKINLLIPARKLLKRIYKLKHG